MTVQVRPEVIATVTTAAGTVNHASSVRQMRSPTSSSTAAQATTETMVFSTTSTDSARAPDRARIMAIDAAPNSATHGSTATIARRSTAWFEPTVVSSRPAPLR